MRERSPRVGGLRHVDAVYAHLVGDVAQRLHPSLIGLLVVGHLQKGGRTEVIRAACKQEPWIAGVLQQQPRTTDQWIRREGEDKAVVSSLLYCC